MSRMCRPRRPNKSLNAAKFFDRAIPTKSRAQLRLSDLHTEQGRVCRNVSDRDAAPGPWAPEGRTFRLSLGTKDWWRSAEATAFALPFFKQCVGSEWPFFTRRV